jgi:hypothetical protein
MAQAGLTPMQIITAATRAARNFWARATSARWSAGNGRISLSWTPIPSAI